MLLETYFYYYYYYYIYIYFWGGGGGGWRNELCYLEQRTDKRNELKLQLDGRRNLQ